MRTGVAEALRPDRRSPRFRRVPFMRDVALDPGRATAPRIAASHVSPSTDENVSAPAILSLSWLTPTPRIIAVYASPRSSPSAPQHSLPGGRYPFPGPDLRRLELASLAWRTSSRLSRYSGSYPALREASADVFRILHVTQSSDGPPTEDRREAMTAWGLMHGLSILFIGGVVPKERVQSMVRDIIRAAVGPKPEFVPPALAA
jgi:hypothetical protein